MILKVERRVDEPDVDYYKFVYIVNLCATKFFHMLQIANWTLANGIVPLYSTLDVDLRRLNHFRIVTIIVGKFCCWAAFPLFKQFSLLFP